MTALLEKFTPYLKSAGIEQLNPMQLASIAANQKSNDCILLSATGTGKTLGFLLPIISQLQENTDQVQAIIIVPVRELAMQIETVFKSFKSGWKINSCYGGHPMSIEKANFTHPPAVVVGTPGRIADHISRNNFELSNVQTLVLDEFDKSLEMGFQDEMSYIIERLKNLKKRILISATDLEEIPAFVGMENPEKLNYLTGMPTGLSVKRVISEAADKVYTLHQLMCNLPSSTTIIFCNHRETVERIHAYLNEKGLESLFFHGGLEQPDRERILCKFRNGTCNTLITTDLAARGLDIPDINHVIHYQLPSAEDGFIHRNGRTARVESKGTAFLLLTKDEFIPSFINHVTDTFELLPNKSNPTPSAWDTLYIGAGKKDKINKMDIVGFLSKVGQLTREDLGLIEVKDFFAYVAIKKAKIGQVMRLTADQKIKGKKIKMSIAK